MTTQIPQFFTTEFTANWEHLVQQKISKLREFLSITTVTGKEKSFNQIGAVSMTQITSRMANTNITDTAMAKRWIRPSQYEKADLLDEWDDMKLGEVSLPTSDLIAAHAAAYARTLDNIALSAAVGTAFTGETGVTSTVLPAGQKVAVDFVESGSAANSGLTVAKLRQAAFILNDNNVDDSDPRIIAVSAKQLQDLLRTTEVRALVSGQLDTFMGFKFRLVDKSFFAYDGATGIRKIVAYAKSGLKLADSGRKVHVDIRPDKSHALQIRTVASIGATRMEEAKIVEIACDEIL
jgi:hypothetical protein